MDDYSPLSKLLHHLALGIPVLSEALFDIEKSGFLKGDYSDVAQKNVFVTGLARAGTTSLMRALYESEDFASLTYQDMPFVLAPNLWAKLSQKVTKKTELKERAHGDGILVNSESPEALDEVFWRIFEGGNYLRSDHLSSHKPSKETLQEFASYMTLVCVRYGKKRYLSKNNNNILRLSHLVDQFSESLFLVPCRSPIDQAQSLLSQHLRFEMSDGFTKKYMGWLAHHEFGSGHRPFDFKGQALEFSKPTDINHWLEIWVNAYQHLHETVKNKPNVIFVSYERLCSDQAYWAELCEKLDIASGTAFSFKQPKSKSSDGMNARLLSQAQDIYQACTAG